MNTRESAIPILDHVLPVAQTILSSLPQSHRHRSGWLCTLALGRLVRHNISDDEQDLDESILHFTHAIFLPFHPLTKAVPNLITAFFFLTNALYRHTQISRQLLASDVKYCIEYLRYLRGLSLDVFGVECSVVTAYLVYALILQAQSGFADVTTNVKEIIVLCHELLTLDDLEGPPAEAIQDFAMFLPSLEFLGLEARLLDQLIKCLREANTRLPGLHDVLYMLSACLFWRFNATKSNGDYDDATTAIDRVIASHSFADDPGRRLREALRLASILAYTRCAYYRKPEDSEEANFRWRTYLNILPPRDLERNIVIQILTDLEETRFNEFGVTNTQADAHSRDPEIVNLPSFSNLVTSLLMSNASLTTADRIQHINALQSVDYVTDTADLDEAIKYTRLLLTSVPPTDLLVPLTAFTLGHLLFRAFKRTGDIEHLNASITVFHDMLNIPDSQWTHFHTIQQLILTLSFRLRLLKDVKDVDRIMRLSTLAVNDTYANLPDRFEVASFWAEQARTFRHHSVTAAYESAFSLMQYSLAFAPTLELQHFRLASRRLIHEKLPLNYASYQLHTGQIERAVETLERGRSLLFSEMRGLRTSLDQLRAVDTPLAEKFAGISRDLETLTMTSVSSGVWLNDGGAEGQHGMDPFGHLIIKQRRLIEERENLLSQIRILPGFDKFSMTPSFDTLQSAAARGPVIIINHSKWRSDIIILLHNSPPSVISTPNDFYHRSKYLWDKLSGARKRGLDSVAYEKTLSSVLESLYDLVGRPLIQRLHQLNVPEQSHIWWCPTSVFCTLPLHAMGPIPSDVGPPRYFLDLYISSYTPSLSALIESRKPSSQALNEPSMLLVLQPDAFMVRALEETQTIQAICPQAKTLIGATATPTVVLERLRDHRFAHIVCHGILEPGKPFESSFKLYNDNRLSLLDIVRAQLPHAEFAFLAACHTAELTDESPSSEALHLAAAMQYCGFRSVVGTMWAMADTDGQDLARNFYKSVFAGQRQGVHYYERTAEALRDAVVKLRAKRGRGMTLERWVNYVHYGA